MKKKSNRSCGLMKAMGIVAVVLMVMVVVVPVGADDGKTVEKPDFTPSIADKKMYEKFYEPRKITPPLPASEITNITFSKVWISERDEDWRSDVVKITFPASWLSKPPEVRENGAQLVTLRVPRELLKFLDTNKDPDKITVDLPSKMFEGYSDAGEMAEDVSPLLLPHSEIGSGSGTKAIEYQERYWYHRTRTDVTGVTGKARPYYYSNDGETFVSYHEREIYSDSAGDLAEIISEITDDGDCYVWVAIYDDHEWITPWNWLRVEASLQEYVDYYVFLDDGDWNVWLYDGNWHYNSYEDDDATHINWLVGSTELDSVGGISEDFIVRTYPIRDDYVYYGGYYRPDTAFEYYSRDTGDPYVYIYGWFDNEGRICTDHFGYN